KIIPGKVRPSSRPHTEAHPQVLIIAPDQLVVGADLCGAGGARTRDQRIMSPFLAAPRPGQTVS
ncbi:hypothetical protein E2F47_23810, partial [Mycobacterium eburneum]